ncbi:12216_t:CDS:2, partial [Funneliformis caledonium]
ILLNKLSTMVETAAENSVKLLSLTVNIPNNFFIYDEPIENDNVISIVKKLQEVTKKYHQEHASQEIHKLRYIENSNHTKRRKN